MPSLEIDGIEIAYEEMGTGPAIVWTPGGFFPRNPFAYFAAGRLSDRHRVIIWDRPNSGASGFAIRESPSEFHLWCDVLHGLCAALGALPAWFGGGSAGGTMTLLMAHLYPADVRGLMVSNSADTNGDWGRAAMRAWYHAFAEAAERGGMEEVLRYSENPPDPEWAWVSRRIAENAGANLDNRRRILDTDPRFFSRVMRRWGDWTIAGRFHLANLSRDELSRIRAPAIVAAGRDEIHTEKVGRELFESLPAGTWVEPLDRWSPETVSKHLAGSPPTGLWLHLPFYQEFLDRVEVGSTVD